jgi:hypothetical protein
MCVSSFSESSKDRLQTAQVRDAGPFSAWFAIWALRSALEVNWLPHIPQWYEARCLPAIVGVSRSGEERVY